MWFFKKKAVFRHGRLEQVSHDFHADSLVVRFRIDGEFFFVSLPQFETPDERVGQLEDLKAGQAVFLGAHQLDDGSFWLHWLKAPGVMELIPPPPREAAGAAREKLLVWGAAAATALLFAMLMIVGGGTGAAIAMGALLLIGGAICGIVAFDGAGALLNGVSHVDRTMHQGLERLNAALAEGRAWDIPGLESSAASPSMPPPARLPPELAVCRVDHARVTEKSMRRPAGRGAAGVDFLTYDFDCDGVSVSWLVRDETFDTTVMPAFRRRHPPFLAEGDQVVVFRANDSACLAGLINRYSLPSLDGIPVLELFNLTDGTAYHSETDRGGSLPFLYVGAALMIAFMVSAVGIMGLFQVSEPEFFPALLSYLGFIAFAICSGILTMGVVLLLMELVFALSDGDPETAAGRKHWRETVADLKRQPSDSWRDSPVWNRFWRRRVWALAVLMAVAGFCLSLWF